MKPTTDQSHDLLACLADTSRFRLVSALTVGDRCVTELARDVGLSQSCTTRHLQALRQAGLVSAERQGKRVVYGLKADEPRVSSLLYWALDASTAGQGARKPSAQRSGVTTRRAAAGSRARPNPRTKPRVAPSPSIRSIPRAGVSRPTPASASEPAAAPEPSPASRTAAGEVDSSVPDQRPPAWRPFRSADIEDFLL